MQVSHTYTYSLSCIWLHFKKLSLLLGSHLLAGLHAQPCSSSAGCMAHQVVWSDHSSEAAGPPEARGRRGCDGCIIKQLLLLQSKVGADQSQASLGDLAVCVEGEEAVKLLLHSVLFTPYTAL